MAACADSCMTSPSLPVSVRCPLPGISVASVTRISPPTSVHARPVATPISFVSSASVGRNRGTPRYSVTLAPVISSLNSLPLDDDLARDLAADRRDLALEVADARLARVALDDRLERFVEERDVRASSSPAPSIAFGDEELLGDLDLLLLGVARELQHFHAVAQRLRDRVQHVGRADEHHVREVGTRRRGSDRGTRCSARGRALRGAPPTDRRGSPWTSCPLRRAGTPDSSSRPSSSSG